MYPCFTVGIGLLVTVGCVDVVGRRLVLVGELGVVLRQSDEGVSRLRPLLGHLEQVGGALVALQGLILLVLPPVLRHDDRTLYRLTEIC